MSQINLFIYVNDLREITNLRSLKNEINKKKQLKIQFILNWPYILSLLLKMVYFTTFAKN
jgi:hypothetical protein